MGTARYRHGGFGITTDSAVACGGHTGTANTNVTEEFTPESTAVNIADFTTS